MRRTWTSKLTPGNKVPTFDTLTTDGTEINPSVLLGKNYILLFYNHDGSETCTKEVCNIRDNFKILKKLGYDVFGVSEDSMQKHTKFISKYQLPFPLISDKGNLLAKTFDIYGSKDFMGRTSDAVHRTTFVINEKGIIVSIIHPVDSTNHTYQILHSLNIEV